MAADIADGVIGLTPVELLFELRLTVGRKIRDVAMRRNNSLWIRGIRALVTGTGRFSQTECQHQQRKSCRLHAGRHGNTSRR
ncbi:hypothetical protein FNB15_15870 [Ferrovibrio terrae]|uniref:Uncharacterized protein n=1 Tax=Ferrovibrio terrae TaxID=2594003 RepID=A0A516H4J3_9PROT|nr:hypothetical protein [Ferrovibrio terrae]QDO98665.1 hypothetical protein FNB15_15870 [Ferrovibrio terrae]